MRLEKYQFVFDRTRTTFDFISEGPKGRILKSVRYTKLKVQGFKNLYNLALGDKEADSSDINDRVVSDNKDLEKILATVANTAIIFNKHHPEAQILIVSDTPSRLRLYRMAISKHYEELSYFFDIQGLTQEGFLPFKKNTDYIAFLITLKISEI